jgi:hypothetical protein
LLVNIAKLTGQISVTSGKMLCEAAQVLARSMLNSVKNDTTGKAKADLDKMICTGTKADLYKNLRLSDVMIKSSPITLVGYTYDLLHSYYCKDMSIANMQKILSALVNVICNPSDESKKLYTALYRQVLYDVDYNYTSGKQLPLDPDAGIFHKGVSQDYCYTYDGSSELICSSYTTPSYYTLHKQNDPLLDTFADEHFPA